MIRMQVNGRLGNQLFQYAFARKLWERTGRQDHIQLEFVSYGEYLRDFNLHYEKTPYDLKKKRSYFHWKFHIQKPILTALAVELAAAKMWRGIAKTFRKDAPETLVYEHKWEKLVAPLLSRLGIYMARYGYVDFRYPMAGSRRTLRAYGCFECSRYFDDIKPILQEEFAPKAPPRPENAEMLRKITESESVCVTIRRGDYLSDQFRDAFYLCTPEYFVHAMRVMKEKVPNAKFFVFSDEPDWCRKHIAFPFACEFESGSDPVAEKLRLMSACKHFIIANSTFSWWAQYLSRNPDKVVIAPSRWRNNSFTEDIYCNQRWILEEV